VVSVLVSEYFFTEINKVQEELIKSSEESGVPLGMFSALLGIKVDEITAIVFNMAIIEAIFGGLAAGKIGEGSFVAGIKHIVIMIMIAVLAFILI
jgi:flagellar protein FlaJ